MAGTIKIKVDYDLCEANAICQKSAPALFLVDDKDKLHVLQETVPADQLEAAKAAVRRCPRRALALVEE